jgi:hypothetical protein
MANQQIYSIFQLGELCNDEDSSIAFLSERGILHHNRECCGEPMRSAYINYRGKELPIWRCKVKGCKATKGLRPGFFAPPLSVTMSSYANTSGTWINPSTLPFTTIVRFIYCWAEELTSGKFCKKKETITFIIGILYTCGTVTLL